MSQQPTTTTISRHDPFAVHRLIIMLLALAAFSVSTARAQLDFLDAIEEQAPPVSANIISDSDTVAAGDKFTVAIALIHADHWHSYWPNTGGITMPTETSWTLPEGWTAGPIQWPTPKVLEAGGANGYAYEHTVHLLAEITTTAETSEGTHEVTASVDWQACDASNCQPGNNEIALDVTIGAATTPNAANTELITKAKDLTPQPLTGWTVTGAQTGNDFQLALTPGEGANTELKSAYFFPDTNYVNAQLPQTLTKDGDRFILELPGYTTGEDGNIDSYGGVEFEGRFTGDLFSEDGLLTGSPTQSMRISVAPGDAVAAAPAEPASLSLGILGLAFLGGLILNLMPCVFPVLGLKIMGFVNQAGEDRKKITMHGMIFTLGVLVSFWILVGALQILKLTRGDVPWGFQLQEPAFVLGLIVLMFIFSLSLTGMLEIGIGATSVGGKLTRKSGFTGTFFSGVLATVVATPCAAPFLAPALGAAIGLPVLQSFIAFTAIALGLSLPYLVLSAFPQLVEKLPKPGPWMETFKQLMAFLMFATVAYLVWVYASLFEDLLQLRALLFGLVTIALGAYVYGRWSAPWRSKKSRMIAIFSALALVVAGTWMAAPKTYEWEVEFTKWSPDAVAEARAQGSPVFIDFTATWCVTCQTNKGRYVNNKEVVELMEKKGIIAMKADFTRKDPVIAKAIADLGRGAVPVNVLYRPGADEPEILDETFGADYLLKVFSDLPDAE